MSNFEELSIPSNAQAVTLSDTVDIPAGQATTIFVGVGGDVKVDTAGGQSAVVFKNVGDGQILPVLVTRVYDTDTDATDIVAIY